MNFLELNAKAIKYKYLFDFTALVHVLIIIKNFNQNLDFNDLAINLNDEFDELSGKTGTKQPPVNTAAVRLLII